MDHWLSFSIGPLKSQRVMSDSLLYLDNILKPKTWLVSKRLTLADIYVFSALMDHRPLESDGKYCNISRWYKQMLALPAVQKALAVVPKNRVAGSAKATKSSGRQEGKDAKRPCSTGNRKQEGTFVELPGAEMGKVWSLKNYQVSNLFFSSCSLHSIRIPCFIIDYASRISCSFFCLYVLNNHQA